MRPLHPADDVEDHQDVDEVCVPISTKDISFCYFFRTKVVCVITSFVVISGAVLGALYITEWHLAKGDGSDPMSNFFFQQDAWAQLDTQAMPKWDTRGSGILRLEVLNALNDHWQPYFNQSLLEWNSGTPDVVALTATRVAPSSDGSCDFVTGKVVVCNGDYGDTNFHGVNEVLVKGGTITASTAKMNEYYMSQITTTNARRQYTMCHEIGHGLGLPHSDESFFNLNQGNCMDYTARPWTNQSPNSHTFAFLNELYGTQAPTTSSSTSGGTAAGDDDDTTSFHGHFLLRRNLRRSGKNSDKDDSDSSDFDGNVPDDIIVRARKASKSLRSNLADSQSSLDWVLLQRTNGTASFQIQLGNGFALQAHFLPAVGHSSTGSLFNITPSLS